MSAPPTCDEYRVKEENLFDLARLLTSDEQMIYFVQSGDDGPIKIGVSTNIGKRLTALQTAHGERLRIVGVMKGDFYGLKINPADGDSGEYNYKPYVFETRIWYDKMYLHPFKIEEIYKGYLVQNPGW
jgi:hypothetical protein